MLNTISAAAIWLATGLGIELPPCGEDFDPDGLEICLISSTDEDADDDEPTSRFGPIRGWIYNGF